MLQILWHDEESNGYTDHIELNHIPKSDHLKNFFHTVVGPRGGRYQAQCDIWIQENIIDFDYCPYKKFNEENGMLIGVMRAIFTDSTRQIVSQILWRNEEDEIFHPSSTTVTYKSQIYENNNNFEKLVEESLKLDPEERLKRLEYASKKPTYTEKLIRVFSRNPDVVAETLSRAKGTCEACNQPAPFQRAHSGTPYLEVHHKIRLADGGDDTVENTIAVCPNCHRKAHYG